MADVMLVGHCGPDAIILKTVVQRPLRVAVCVLWFVVFVVLVKTFVALCAGAFGVEEAIWWMPPPILQTFPWHLPLR